MGRGERSLRQTSGTRRQLIDLAPLRESRSFRLLWSGQLVSLTGTQLRLVAIPYQVYLLTGSSLDVGLIGLFQAVPLITLALFGGVVADRVDRRRLLIVTQIGLAACSALLAIGTQLGFAGVLYLYAFTAVGAAFSALDSPARGALTPSLVAREQLPAAMALNQVLFQTAAIGGPALAGVVILAFGVAGAYWIDVASFAVAIVAVAALVAPPREVRMHPPVGRALAEGLAHFKANRILSATMLLDFLATFFGSPRALFPFYADRVFAVGPEGLGLLFAAPGIGSLVAALASGWTKGVRRQGVAVLLAVAGWGLAIAAFGLMSDGLFVPALVFIAVAQGADTISAIFRSTILLTVVPDHLRGRLVAISSMFFLGGPYLGQVESGVIAGVVSPQFSVISGGLATLASVVGIALWAPEVSRYESPAPEPKAASSDA
jgi:MFS family permease